MFRHYTIRSKGLEVVSLALALGALAAAGCKPTPVTPDEAGAAAEDPSQQATAGAGADPARQAAEQAARGRSEEWLALVDGGQYAESWDHAAPLFQSSTSKTAWQGALEGARGPLGKLASRRFRAAQHATSLQGAPEGQYFTIHYDTVFAERPKAREVVTLMLVPDASWRVVGYFIEPEAEAKQAKADAEAPKEEAEAPKAQAQQQ